MKNRNLELPVYPNGMYINCSKRQLGYHMTKYYYASDILPSDVFMTAWGRAVVKFLPGYGMLLEVIEDV